MRKMARKKVIILSVVFFLALVFIGIFFYGFFIPGSIFNLLKTGTYTKILYGEDIFQGNENGYQYTVQGNVFTSTGDDPLFFIDISGEPQFDFIRIDISNLAYACYGEIYFWADSDEGWKWVTTDRQSLKNGVNVFQLPVNHNVQVLRFDLGDRAKISFNLNHIMFTNNWYVSPYSIVLILGFSLLVSLIFYSVLAYNIPKDADVSTEMRERNVLGLLCVLTLTIPLAYITVMTVIKTNTYLDVARIEQIYRVGLSNFAPEPHEMQRYMLYCVLICGFSLGFTLLYQKHMNRIPYQAVRIANPVLFAFFALIFVWPLYEVAAYDNNYYLKYLSFYNHLFWTMILFALGMGTLFLYRKSRKSLPQWRWAVWLVDAAIVGLILYVSMIICYYNLENLGFAYHFSAVFSPIFELSNGQTPGVDFSPLYGLYGYFFYNLQRIIWGNIHYRDTIMLLGILLLINNIALYVFLIKMFRRRSIAAVTMAAILFFTQVFYKVLADGYPHYAYLPIRTIVSAITLGLIGFIHTTQARKAKIAFIIAAAFVATGGILWSPETGLIATVTLAGFMLYRALAEHRLTEAAFWKKAAFALTTIILCFLVWMLILQLVTIRRSGEWYPISSLFWSITVFSQDGFYLTSLPEKHPYVYVLWTYSTVVILSLYSLFRHKAKPNAQGYDNALGFTVSIMGFGLLTYFIGRSPVGDFAGHIWPAFIALAFVTVKLYGYSQQRFTEWREHKFEGGLRYPKLVSMGIVAIAALLFAFFLFATGFSLYTVSGTDAMKGYKAARTIASMPTSDGLALVDRYRAADLFVIDAYSMFYLSELNLKNEYKGQATVDFFFKQDVLNVVAQLEKYRGRVLLGPITKFFYTTVFEDGETFEEKLHKVLAERYICIVEEGGWLVYDYANK